MEKNPVLTSGAGKMVTVTARKVNAVNANPDSIPKGNPKNALEEKLRKPYHERRREEESRRNKRMGDEERQSRRSETGDNNAGQQREQEHNEARTSRIVKFRQPQLSADKEQPIIHGRAQQLATY